jgi:CubicO group peptidase (beta-lactamase class C family)
MESQTLPAQPADAPLPAQPADAPWPDRMWPTAGLPARVNRRALDRLLGEAFDAPDSPQLGETHALFVVQGGRAILERYAAGFDADRTYPSWSMAKSITQALIGILVGDGLIDIHAPADVPEWTAPGDPRAPISIDLLLRMSSGLSFVEDYVPGHVSDVREMLFGDGKADVAHYAASRPLAHAPGAFFSYSSGTTNILARCASRALGATGDGFARFMRTRLFDPIGMTSAIPRFDDAGVFIGSSYCFCTARDFARFGLLYLRGGVWKDQRILPAGWVDYARTPTWQQPHVDDDPYGAHWWLGIGGPGSFSANGYGGQYIVLVPRLDLIIVRHGDTPLDLKPALKRWIGDVVRCFD